MIRVRRDGVIQPIHWVGLQRAVRGELHLADKHIPSLNRHARVATFRAETGEVLELMDAALMHASGQWLVLSGFERVLLGVKDADCAQTWVLTEPQCGMAEGTMGPAFPG